MQPSQPHPATPFSTPRAVPSLMPGSRLGGFEIQRVIARSLSSVVYLATDHPLAIPVAIQEYLPTRYVRRDAEQRLQTTDPQHEDVVGRGLRAFIDEARLLARCDHPALVRVSHLFEANGTAYRVMPYHVGQRLLDLRRNMRAAPDEASLRALLEGLLGALEALHRTGHAHGGVAPANILLLADDRPLLLGPGAAGREVNGDLVASLMAGLQPAFTPLGVTADAETPATVGAGDLHALAQVMRFCIIGAAAPPTDANREPEPIAVAIARTFEPAARPNYSAALLSALDAALSPFTKDRPHNAAQWRDWLVRGAPRVVDHAVPPVAAGTLGESAGAPTTSPMPAAPPVPAPAVPHRPGAPPALSGRPAAPAMTTDRAPWGPTAPTLPRTRRTSSNWRWRQALLGGALAVLGVAVVAIATGAWEGMPAIKLDSLAGLAAGLTAAAPPASMPATAIAPTAPISTPMPSSTLSPAPESSAAPEAPAPDAQRAADPALAPAVTAAPLDPALVPSGAPAPAPAPAPATAAAAAAPGVGADRAAEAPASSTFPLRRTPPRGARAAVVADAPAPDPRAACAPRTEFALYRCMQNQCRSARWSQHPQCVRLRSADTVD